MRRLKQHELPDWPRLMNADLAAAYCGGVSIPHFIKHCPVAPRKFGSRKLWDRKQIDAWLDEEIAIDDPRQTTEYWLDQIDLANDARKQRRRA